MPNTPQVVGWLGLAVGALGVESDWVENKGWLRADDPIASVSHDDSDNR